MVVPKGNQKDRQKAGLMVLRSVETKDRKRVRRRERSLAGTMDELTVVRMEGMTAEHSALQKVAYLEMQSVGNLAAPMVAKKVASWGWRLVERMGTKKGLESVAHSVVQ